LGEACADYVDACMGCNGYVARPWVYDEMWHPQEMYDLSKECPERLSYWREKLIRELCGREEGFVQDGKLVAGRPQSPTLRHVGKGI